MIIFEPARLWKTLLGGIFFIAKNILEKKRGYYNRYFFQQLSAETPKQELMAETSLLTDRKDTLRQRPSSKLNWRHCRAHWKSVCLMQNTSDTCHQCINAATRSEVMRYYNVSTFAQTWVYKKALQIWD